MRVEGYTKRDGTVVQGYEREGGKKAEDAPKTKQSASVAAPDSKISHLIPDEMRVGRRQHGGSKKDKIRAIEAELMSQAESGEEARDVAARIGKEKLREISEKAIAAASKPLVQYSFSEYKDAINPEGKRHDDDVYSSRTDDWLEDKADRYTEHLYDKDGVSYRYEKTLNKYVHPDSKHREGEEIRYMSPEEVKASGNPVYDISIGAIVDGKVAGTLSDSFGAIDLFVRDGFRGKGIGSELQYIARTANPFYSSGGFSKGGEALAEGTFWRLNGLPKEGPAELQEARAELWALKPLFDEKYEEIVVAAQNKAKQIKGKYSDHHEALEDPEYRDALRAENSSWDTLRDWENSVYKPMAAPIKERIKKIKETPVSEFKKAPQTKSMIRKGWVDGYTKADGTVVEGYEREGAATPDEPAQPGQGRFDFDKERGGKAQEERHKEWSRQRQGWKGREEMKEWLYSDERPSYEVFIEYLDQSAYKKGSDLNSLPDSVMREVYEAYELPYHSYAEAEFDREHVVHVTRMNEGEINYIEPQIGDFTANAYGYSKDEMRELGARDFAFFTLPSNPSLHYGDYQEGIDNPSEKEKTAYILVAEKPGDAVMVDSENGQFLHEYEPYQEPEGESYSYPYAPFGVEPGDIVSEEGAEVKYAIPLKDYEDSGARNIYDYIQSKGIEPVAKSMIRKGDDTYRLQLLHRELLPLQRNPLAVQFMSEIEGAMYEINSLEAKSYLASVNTHFWTA